ncbi:predicted protein [Sclerotinia sclerotiorum 1980 UF-70]|uniref:Uncharacterized protein n=1 Tax=Sclerotinia sclerotiorum (strain ATCC 18683 / 1980 / Ss-1) TaxID=665079 RepID=A7EVK3_SCLS1|nr:predicted protein [Sclerotinia sclerotiorum 1980 UF-70]EDN93495.1 predicted protein [Sclerotinia sclerotiorum 1980 UF-70]
MDRYLYIKRFKIGIVILCVDLELEAKHRDKLLQERETYKV